LEFAVSCCRHSRAPNTPFAAREPAVCSHRLVHYRERVGGQQVLAGQGSKQHVVTRPQPTAAAQRGRDHDAGPGRHGDHAARVAACHHHPGVGGEGQPVTAAPAQRGDGRPVGDPARGVDAAEPVDHVRAARRPGQWHRTARTRLALPAARAGGGDDRGNGPGSHGCLPDGRRRRGRGPGRP
jgi:hypothetical protein